MTEIALLERADEQLVDELARLVNDVYRAAESGLWRDGFRRTTASELSELIAAGELAVATGRALLDFAEQRSRERGQRALRLELLLPRTWQHPSKEFLKAWYGRRGYRLIRTSAMDDAYPHLAPLLATECDLAVYEKPLRQTGAGSKFDGSAGS